MTRSLACLAAVAVLLGGCSFGGETEHPSPRLASSTPARVSVAPDSPAVVAATAVARRSREPVLGLRAVATATLTGRGAAPTELRTQAATARQSLRALIIEATRLPPPAGTPAAALVSSLRSFERIAGYAASGAAVRDWRGRLEAADAGWRTALRRLSEQSGIELLADLPALTLPGR